VVKDGVRRHPGDLDVIPWNVILSLQFFDIVGSKGDRKDIRPVKKWVLAGCWVTI